MLERVGDKIDLFERPVGRSLFLGDIENLAWDRKTNTLLPHKVELVSQAVNEMLAPYEVQEIIASSKFFAEAVWFHWGRNARRLCSSGPDAADLELMKVITSEDLPTRFTTVFIGSGDGIFAKPASRLASQGVQVITLTGTGALSKKLKLATNQSIPLFNEFSEKANN